MIVISSVEFVHVPLLIVHLKVELAPTVSPVIVVVGELTVVIVAVPLTTLHDPVPVVAVLPAMVAVLTLHKSWSAPAFAVVGVAATFIMISSVEFVQAPLLIVHLNVALAPTVKPVNVVVGEEAVVIVAVPDTTLHVPVPVVGVLPAIVAVVTLHKF